MKHDVSKLTKTNKQQQMVEASRKLKNEKKQASKQANK